MGDLVDMYISDIINKDICNLLRGNDNFSKLKGLDLQELINLIESFYLIYRPTLGLDKGITFGTEIEYEKLSRLFVNNYINNNFMNWKSIHDDSIKFGGEIVSPKLNDCKETWEALRTICNFLKDNNAKALDYTGSHIHIGAHILDGNKDKIFNFFEVYVGYEKVLSRFFFGESLCAREYMNLNIKNITKVFNWINYDYINGKLTMTNLDSFFKKLDKGNVIRTDHADLSNIDKKGNTIEIRAANGTLEEIIWQNNINTSIKLLLAIKNDKIDMDLVKFKIKNEFIKNVNDKNLFNKIYIEDALELADMIFDNNLDKVYFLRQYFKNFETVFDSKQLVKGKSFINQDIKSINKIA